MPTDHTPDAVTEAVRAWEAADAERSAAIACNWSGRYYLQDMAIRRMWEGAAATAIAALSADRERLQAALGEAEAERTRLASELDGALNLVAVENRRADAAEARATAAEAERDEWRENSIHIARVADMELDAATTRAERLSAVVEAVRALIRDRADYTPQGLCDEIWHIIDADRAPTTGEGE